MDGNPASLFVNHGREKRKRKGLKKREFWKDHRARTVIDGPKGEKPDRSNSKR